VSVDGLLAFGERAALSPPGRVADRQPAEERGGGRGLKATTRKPPKPHADRRSLRTWSGNGASRDRVSVAFEVDLMVRSAREPAERGPRARDSGVWQPHGGARKRTLRSRTAARRRCLAMNARSVTAVP